MAAKRLVKTTLCLVVVLFSQRMDSSARADVITFVDSNYRTDSNGRTYFGYSLGGEFGAFILDN